MEIELKYTVADPTVFAALAELPALGGYALRPERWVALLDHYMDTPNRDLLRGGYACRLREGVAQGSWLLTVKRVGGADGALHQREEHESIIPTSANPATWPESPAREIVTRLSGGQALVELFALRQHRMRRIMSHNGRTAAVLSLDTIWTDIAGHETVTHEIEIELTAAGTVDDLRSVSADLQAYKLQPQSKSKFERALASLKEAEPGPEPAQKLRADEPWAEAGRKILRFHFLRMLANEDGTCKGADIEALHDMRVATRRQRAIFRLVARYFHGAPIRSFRDELRTLAGRLGAVRDFDVLIEAARNYRSTAGVRAPEALEPLLEEWRTRRSIARDELVAYLHSYDYRAFKERYKTFLSSTYVGIEGAVTGDSLRPRLVRDILPAKIWRQYRKVRKYETALEDAPPIETLHALRIEGKRLRYLLEFFRDVLGPEVDGAIEAMTALQDHLGELHDADVTVGLLQDFLMRSKQSPLGADVTDAVREYLKIKEARLRRLYRTFERPWRRVARKRFRKSLTRMLAEL